ncbi:MAG: protein phosphatase 2C domain-containing protein [Polyangiaceae bacterium]
MASIASASLLGDTTLTAAPTLNELRTRASALTHRGHVRENNEDQFLIGDVSSAIHVKSASLCPTKIFLGSSPLSLLIVADGMGGHAGGERASAIAVSSVEAFILRTLGHLGALRIQNAEDLLRSSFEAADGSVLEASRSSSSLAGMGTTMTVALVRGSEAHIAHAGDSRAYLIRDRSLNRLTRDHTVAEELKARDNGAGSRVAVDTETLRHMSHMITNAVGGGTAGVEPDVTRIELRAGDRILLCTDGLTNMVDDARTIELINANPSLDSACQTLVDAALAAGGQDNVTVLVANVEAA